MRLLDPTAPLKDGHIGSVVGDQGTDVRTGQHRRPRRGNQSVSPAGPWLDADEAGAWRAFRQMALAVQVRTGCDLADLGLSEADYEVLSTLSERPGGRSELREQAAKMGWSRSRLSHHATRMEARGLLGRAPDPQDGRGCFLVLTESGLEVLASAAPAHVASVRRHLLDHLDHSDLQALDSISRKVVSPEELP